MKGEGKRGNKGEALKGSWEKLCRGLEGKE
jgi:hypothetical protein